jgi:nucleoside-diphosphate-sugar epimerase
MLITGGSGFLGSAIARRLCELGQQVRIFDISDSPDRPAGAEFFHGDVRDQAALRKACAGVEIVYHNSALVPLTKAGRRFREINVQGSANVLRAARDAGARKLVHASSSAIYGVPKYCPIDEKTSPAPIEPYGRSKLDGERAVFSHRERGGPTVTIIRPRTIVGTGRLGIFKILFDWIREGKNIYIIGRGDGLFQFLHIEDLVDAMIFAAGRDEYETYNVGAAEYSTLRNDLTALCGHAGTGSRVRSLPVWPSILALRALDLLKLSPLAPWHYLTYHKPFYFDISKAVGLLGWKPRYSNIAMLTEAYDKFLEGTLDLAGATSMHRKSPAERILKLLRWVS